MPTRIAVVPSSPSFARSPTGTSRPRSRRAASTSAAGPRHAPSRSTAALRQPARRGHLAELEQRPAQPERREALLLLGADVARLVDRLGIVAARAARVAGRDPQVADAARLRASPAASSRACSKCHSARCAPDVGRPPVAPSAGAAPWPPPRPPRRGDDRQRARPRGTRAELAAPQRERQLRQAARGASALADSTSRGGAPERGSAARGAARPTPSRVLVRVRAGRPGRTPQGPAAARRSSTRSTRSHGRSRSLRPKWP